MVQQVHKWKNQFFRFFPLSLFVEIVFRPLPRFSQPVPTFLQRWDQDNA
jgi:hypothetical protein